MKMLLDYENDNDENDDGWKIGRQCFFALANWHTIQILHCGGLLFDQDWILVGVDDVVMMMHCVILFCFGRWIVLVASWPIPIQPPSSSSPPPPSPPSTQFVMVSGSSAICIAPHRY